jgi:hypothetical protein
MGHHKDWHPQPVSGCFGCRTLDQGYLGLKSRRGPDPVQTVPVIADDGKRAGQRVGVQKVHWDGRQDAVAMPAPMKIRTSIKAE